MRASCLVAVVVGLWAGPSFAASAALTDGETYPDDDECRAGDEDCALSALQLRARAQADEDDGAEAAGAAGSASGYEVGSTATGLRRRRHHRFLYPTTNITVQYTQPHHCKNTTLKKGREGCCGGLIFELKNAGCCGTIPFYTSQLGCCDHGDGTATLYDPLSQNCCDDEFKLNKERGICEVPRGETSCCQIQSGRRRRRRRRSTHR